jgi:biopolymer transport protein TolQ
MRKSNVLALTAFVVLVVLGAVGAGAAMAEGEPRAAPTGASAESAPLAAPTVGVETASDRAAVSALGSISMTRLFMRADPLVKAVMLLLLAASLASWMIIINKWWKMSRLRRSAETFEKVFWSGQPIDDLYRKYSDKNDHPFSAVFVAAVREWRRSFELVSLSAAQLSAVKERVSRTMSVTISREVDEIESQLGFLASVASTAPFVGLFGTVWGIMNSFAAIAARHDTTLAVVAPGIAEALFATAMGLLAAIPAAFFYNSFVGSIGRYTNRLDAFAEELDNLLSRLFDEKGR